MRVLNSLLNSLRFDTNITLCGVFGFLVFQDAFFGKMMGAFSFAVIGWFLSFIFSAPIRLIPSTKIATTIRTVICIAFACLVFTTDCAEELKEDDYLPSGHSHTCYSCDSKASYVYGGDYLCAKHYYLSKGMDGDFNP